MVVAHTPMGNKVDLPELYELSPFSGILHQLTRIQALARSELCIAAW